ncbi:MAG TPA: dienelactone hydrolase family protein [Candidatus Methylomirabilis sp.]|nr:dienelactone hydrolase family protein [Candidatus Methylomirabilis sp.]
MEIRSEYVQLTVNDGSTMRAWTARPKEEGAFPGLLVLQEAFGVNAHIRDVAGRFAREGYVTLAPELFHRTGPGFEGQYDNFPGVMPHLKALNDASMAADLRAAHDWLRGAVGPNLPICAIGYCMGGRAAFLAALTVPLAGAISYYGGGIAPNPTNPGLLGRTSGLQAPMLFFWGGRDRHITPGHAQAVTGALRAAGKSFVNVEISNADHGFFCDARASYSPAAAALAWPLTLAFLQARR